jgi:hypothetical protein
VQESLVLLPYTIHRHRPQATSTEHAGSYLALSGLFSMLAIAMFSMAALGLSTALAPHGLVAATLVLAAAVPFASLREFGRRVCLGSLARAAVPDAGPRGERRGWRGSHRLWHRRHRGSRGMTKDLVQAFVLGKDPFRIEELWTEMYDHSFWAKGGGQSSSRE